MELKPHAVCVPAPAQGHINAMLQLAKVLHFAGGLHITFVNTQSTHDRILETCGPRALDGLPGFRFETVPDGMQSSSTPSNGEQLTEVCGVIRKKLAGPFRELCRMLNESDGPRITCVISDSFASYPIEIAAELGVPDVSFCSVSAAGFWGFFKFEELIERGIVPLKSEDDLHNGYLDTCVVDWIQGTTMCLKYFPSFLRTTDPNHCLLNLSKDEIQDSRKATAIIFNTFDQLEGPVLDAISSVMPPIYTVGPLNLMCRQISDESLKSIRLDFWKEDSTCLEWLEGKAHGSVVYVNFGSLTAMTEKTLVEFAWGLANSGHNFLWVIRPNITSGDSVALPKEFLLEVAERGLLVSWCQQEEVLMHPAIGGFLTHCGWNSTMESISEGVPMICWPYFADQQPNCWYICNEFGVGLEISNDVKREEVEGLIKELLGGEKGIELRKMTMKWKETTSKAIEPDGTSFLNLKRMISEVLVQGKDHV